ncbi:MAG TPA: methyltransferase domain-containing protein [Nitrospirota bacterium]|nr:methyltransferase domain-containing protein [Nitrospirota bacterium]
MLFRRKRIKKLSLYAESLNGKNGLEIGGPSHIFTDRGLIPLYRVMGGIDGCNFCEQTIWQGTLKQGAGNYQYHNKRPGGYQYLLEATGLHGIAPGTYDAVLSSHCIEHSANPIKALSEWIRVLKTGGMLVLVVPHKDGTFDHKRPLTTLEHLILDYDRSTGEGDLGHLPEILEHHDLAMDPPSGDFESFRRRSLQNIENRCLHQHVFDTDLVVRIVDYSGLEILDLQTVLPYHIIVLARKNSGIRHDNSSFLSSSASYQRTSPFSSDRNAR